MLVAAISAAGAEYMYSARTCHAVPKSSGQKICDALNAAGFRLRSGETWHLHDIESYSGGYDFALCQAFRVYRGAIREYR